MTGRSSHAVLLLVITLLHVLAVVAGEQKSSGAGSSVSTFTQCKTSTSAGVILASCFTATVTERIRTSTATVWNSPEPSVPSSAHSSAPRPVKVNSVTGDSVLASSRSSSPSRVSPASTLSISTSKKNSTALPVMLPSSPFPKQVSSEYAKSSSWNPAVTPTQYVDCTNEEGALQSRTTTYTMDAMVIMECAQSSHPTPVTIPTPAAPPTPYSASTKAAAARRVAQVTPPFSNPTSAPDSTTSAGSTLTKVARQESGCTPVVPLIDGLGLCTLSYGAQITDSCGCYWKGGASMFPALTSCGYALCPNQITSIEIPVTIPWDGR